MLPAGPLLTHLVTPPLGFALLESSLTVEQCEALEATVQDLGAAYAERMVRAGTIIATDRLELAASYVQALRAEDVLPPGIYGIILPRWRAVAATLLLDDLRVEWFVDAFVGRYSVRRAAAARANLRQL